MPDARPLLDATPFAAAPRTGRRRWNAQVLLATMAVGALLYVGQALFVPLALAALLAFVLDPVVGALRRVGLPRTPAVVVVMLGTVLVVAATSLFVIGQVTQLAKDLPTYQSTVQTKLRNLRQGLAENAGSLSATNRLLGTVNVELNAAARDLAGPARTRAAPTPVEVVPAPRTAWQAVGDLVDPLLGPLGTAGAVLLFLMFVLIERHDLRDRLLRLSGAELHRSTDALSEAGERVSRYLSMQLVVNLSYGVPLGLGLWLIGVPGALLWGLLGALLRFVPYAGPVVAAVFPLTLAFAVDPGWEMVLWTLGLVVVLELISNNIIEPWLYGASTGLSPLALIVSAMFWTLLWGPIGLILATPLTVCLAVVGRHVAPLAWLETLLGSEPVFDHPTRLVQRLLAGDVEEAIDLAEEQVRSDGLQGFLHQTAVPALALAARTPPRSVSAAHRLRFSQGCATLLRSLRDDAPARVADGPARVLCVGVRGELDALSSEALALALQDQGIAVRVEPPATVSADQIQLLDLAQVRVLCLSATGEAAVAQLRFIARRLKRRQPGLQVLVGLWNAPPALLEAAAWAELGVDGVARSVQELVQRTERALAEGAAATSSGPAQPPMDGGPHGGGREGGPADAPAALAEEVRRQRALIDSGATAPTARAVFDRAALRAAEVFDAPMAMVTLVDGEELLWAGAAGLDVHAPDVPHRHPRSAWPTTQVVAHAKALVIEDANRDAHWEHHPSRALVGLRAYAAAPLRTADGTVIGSLCVVDTEARHWDASERALLHDLAADVAAALQRHTANAERQAERQAEHQAALAREARQAAETSADWGGARPA